MSFAQRRAVRFQDVDAAGIVFFPRVLEYFHDVYMAFYDSLGVSIAEVIATRAWAAPLKHAEADFLRPLRFGQEIEVAMVSGQWEKGRLTVRYRVTSGGDEVATGLTVHVFVDVTEWKRIEPPESIRAAFSALAP
jgi:YbgC/YbaW family acyl-CoA thioester hydrolase